MLGHRRGFAPARSHEAPTKESIMAGKSKKKLDSFKIAIGLPAEGEGHGVEPFRPAFVELALHLDLVNPLRFIFRVSVHRRKPPACSIGARQGKGHDGFVKSPDASLRYILRHCGVCHYTPHSL
jgi:hypothetical protein